MSEILFNEINQTPIILNATHLSNIFSIKFDNQNRRIISAGKWKEEKKIYLKFSSFFVFVWKGNDEQILIHDIEKQNQ